MSGVPVTHICDCSHNWAAGKPQLGSNIYQKLVKGAFLASLTIGVWGYFLLVAVDDQLGRVSQS